MADKHTKNQNIGSSFDEFLKEDGILEECELYAKKALDEFAAKKAFDLLFQNKVKLCNFKSLNKKLVKNDEFIYDYNMMMSNIEDLKIRKYNPVTKVLLFLHRW